MSRIDEQRLMTKVARLYYERALAAFRQSRPGGIEEAGVLTNLGNVALLEGNFESALNDSHMERGVGTPHFTRPAEYEGLKVPEPLLGGDHARIERYRRAAAIRKCLANRPDLLSEEQLTTEERKLLDEFEDKDSER